MDGLEFKIVPDEDIDDAITLMAAFFSPENKFNSIQAKKNLYKAKEKSSYELFGSYKDNNLIGVMGLRPLYDPLDEKHGYELNNFIIKDEYKGLGIGKKFIEFSHDYMKSDGAEFCRLFVNRNITRLVEYYKSSDYKKGLRDYYWVEF